MRSLAVLLAAAGMISLGGIIAPAGGTAEISLPADSAPAPQDAGHAGTEPGKARINVFASESYLPLPFKISATEWIIEGRILNGTVMERWSAMGYRDEDAEYTVNVDTVYMVEVMEVLRGSMEKKIISVAVTGGETERYSMNYDRHEVIPGEHFIMFLSEGSCRTRHLSDFRTIAPSGGLYLVEGGIAKNNVESESLPADDLRWEIAWLAWMPKFDVPGVIKRPCLDQSVYEAAHEEDMREGRMRSLWPFENSTYGSVEGHMDELMGLPEVKAFHEMYEGRDITFSDMSTASVRLGFVAQDGDRSAHLIIGYYNREASDFSHVCIDEDPRRLLFEEEGVRTDCFVDPGAP
ncbi:hypothetical protein CENSYa_0493 [Cenarchaeum symbiosum A]|uniref:Uncharacterized protein n=1 Tax=Cenarchaeum symbiosum (strain A) TaxID=414004 RepID=A0RUV9_CENSY|nr:hypothetical protein CENSYa_0493 [Cenarchaeum symbiosum A]